MLENFLTNEEYTQDNRDVPQKDSGNTKDGTIEPVTRMHIGIANDALQSIKNFFKKNKMLNSDAISVLLYGSENFLTNEEENLRQQKYEGYWEYCRWSMWVTRTF